MKIDIRTRRIGIEHHIRNGGFDRDMAAAYEIGIALHIVSRAIFVGVAAILLIRAAISSRNYAALYRMLG